jgi:hypothetical protein
MTMDLLKLLFLWSCNFEASVCIQIYIPRKWLRTPGVNKQVYISHNCETTYANRPCAKNNWIHNCGLLKRELKLEYLEASH